MAQSSIHFTGRQIRDAWLIGSGIESLGAAFYLINHAKVSGRQIHIMGAEFQSNDEELGCCDLAIDQAFIAESPFFCQDLCIFDLVSKSQGSFWNHDPQSPSLCKNGRRPEVYAPRHPTEVFISEPSNSQTKNRSSHVWPKNRKKIVDFLLKDEGDFEGKTIQDIFDKSFLGSDLWELFSSNFGLRPVHCAMEFHRHLCKYLDYIQEKNLQSASPLQHAFQKPILQCIQLYLQEQGVSFLTRLSVSDIRFCTDTEPRTVCEIQASDNGRSVVFPVATDDIVIVTVGSPISGSLFGSNGVPPPGIQAAAETLLNWDWSIWFNLAAKSTKFGNPSAFCTQISESLLETFTATFPAPEFKVICAHITHALPQDRHLISVADSNWSLKVVLPQQPAFTGQRDNLCFILGYALTPKECGNFIKKPMCVCSGDEILAELLWHFNIPFQNILPTANAVPHLMPFGLSPLLKRSYGDRPNIIPRGTTNIALVGQYVETEDDTTLSLEYGVRCAELAVHHLTKLGNKLPGVKKSKVVARYGNHAKTSRTIPDGSR